VQFKQQQVRLKRFNDVGYELFRIMIKFLSRLQEMAGNKGGTIAFIDQEGRRSTNYAQFNEYSSRVASWLQEKAIGRGDVVAILLPRGMEYFVAELAVFKAGACFIPLDSHQASDRREYILKDSQAKLVLTMKEYREALTRRPLDRWAEAASHDLAFIIYTSGSTGNPKGVMQEYGAIDTLIQLAGDIFDFSRYYELAQGQFRFALVTPFIFVATMDVMVCCLWEGGTVCIISEELLRNVAGLLKFFIEYNIHGTFMPMSLYKRLPANLELPLRLVALGSEPVAEVCSGRFCLLNCYSMTEMVLPLAQVIDKSYKVTPVGRPYSFLKVRLLGEDGRVNDREGLLCVKLPYFRGYLSLPEKNAAAFIQLEGERFFITGDLARWDEQGRLLILGRADDMIKINGNRVEPGEVEGAILRVLPQVRQVVVRGFTDRNDLNYLCAYYLAEEEISPAQFRAKLRKEITEYMYPRYYMRLDRFPVTVSGKVARRQLPEPQTESYRAQYCPPEGELEKVLCAGFSKILQVERVGAVDDFYLLGGDSLGTMSLVAGLPIDGITFKEIMDGRTPRKIAQLCRERNMTVRQAGKLAQPKVRRADYPVRTMQRGILDLQMVHAKSTAWNLGGLYKIDPALDFDRLVQAVETVLGHYAVFGTQFFIDEETIELRQRFVKERIPLKIEELSEEALSRLKDTLRQPFHLLNTFMYRVRAFRTPSGGYLFFDFHHTIVDGTSLQILFRTLEAVYQGQSLPEDGYDFQDVLEQEFYTDQAATTAEAESVAFKDFLATLELQRYLPLPDYETKKDQDGDLFLPVPNLAKSSFEGKSYGGNVFFMTAALLTQAKLLGNEDAFLVWTYNGRNTGLKMNVLGPLLHDNPMHLKLAPELSAADLLQKVNDVALQQMKYLPDTASIMDPGIDGNCMGFIYQQELHSTPVLAGRKLEPVEIADPLSARSDVFDLEIWERPDGFLLFLHYDGSRYAKATAERFGREFLQLAVLMARQPLAKVSELLR
jgi:mycobactin peptide synthetase MbtE